MAVVSAAVAASASLEDPGYAHFQRVVCRLTGVDLSSYRQVQLRRRLEALRTKVGAVDFTEYAKVLEREPRRLEEFRDYLTINVTEFFRDTPHFQRLAADVVPSLLATRPSLRVWSAGCSIGAEPYSLAIILMELARTGMHRVVATDLDRLALVRARSADDYTTVELRGVSAERRTRFFAPSVDRATWAVRREVKNLVEFREQDLLNTTPRGGFDLILCRNVVIYFTEEAKRGLHDRLVSALRPGGVLLLGATEILPGAERLGMAVEGPSLYRRVAAPSR